MSKDKEKEMRTDAISIAANISDKGYTVEEMMIIIGYLQAISKEISDNALRKAAAKDCFPDAACLKSYF